MANLAAKRAAAQNHETPSLAQIREAGDGFDAIAPRRRRNVNIRDVELPLATATLKAGFTSRSGQRYRSGYFVFPSGRLVIMHHLTDDYFCSLLADECRAKLITLDYRLCPEHAFPAAIEDGLALWDYVHDNAENLGIDRRRVALAGDSAGGLIASIMCQLLRDKAKLEKSPNRRRNC